MQTLIVFVLTAVLMNEIANGEPQACEKEMIRTCGERYKKAAIDTALGHCDRLQVMMDCLAENPSCKGTVITSFRFWMLQMGLMDTIMKNCMALNTDSLKDIVKDIITNKALYVDSIDPSIDTNQPCAVKLHGYCVGQYINNLRRNRLNLCSAVEGLNSCYETNSQRCDVAIIRHFKDILSKVAYRVVNVLREHIPVLCQSDEL